MDLKPGYKRTDIGVIPADWEVKRLGDIGESLIGLTYSPTNVKSDGLLVLRSSNVQEGELVFDDNVFVDIDVADRIMVRKGDILVCVRNGSRDLIGKCAMIDENAEGMTFGAFMAVFRTPFKDFIFYQFQSSTIKRQIQEHLGATINQITNRSLNSFRVQLPTDEGEQRAIAAALSDVDALIGALNRLIAKKRDLKQAAMQQLLTGQCRLPGFQLPWTVERLGKIADIQRGASPRPIDSPIWYDSRSTVGWVRISDVAKSDGRTLLATEDYLSPKGVAASRFLPSGTLIMSICATVGRPVITGFNTCIHDGFVSFSNLRRVDKRFLFYKLKQLENHFKAIGQTGSQANLNTDLVNNCEVELPEWAEQESIVAVLFDMDAEIAALEQRRDKTRALKQGMMQELLTGRTRLV